MSRVVVVRDSKDPDGPKIIISRDEFQEFAGAVKNL